MRIRFSLRSFLVYSVLLLVLSIATFGFFSKELLKARISHAQYQIDVFWELVDECEEAEAVECAEKLEYVVKYYPSGTKQIAGSAIDSMVESARHRASLEIIRELRCKTNLDYGNDIDAWLKHFREEWH